MSDQEKVILTLVELLKKNSLHITYPDNIENNNNDDHEDDECIKKLTKNRYKLIYSMCQATKVMDYLESVGVIPRS
ncbi:unnamed protein product, partial [Adineta steineri]